MRVDPNTHLGSLGSRSLEFSFEPATLRLTLSDDANTDVHGLFAADTVQLPNGSGSRGCRARMELDQAHDG